MKIGTDGVLLGAWAFAEVVDTVAGEQHLSILDVGAGTGLIALQMAQRFKQSRVAAVEIDSVAADEAAENFANSRWASRLTVVCDDINHFASVDSNHECFDLIVSNPPYFSNGVQAPDEARRSARHEGGLNVESLMRLSSAMLKLGGRLAMVLPAEHIERVKFQATLCGLHLARVCSVKSVARKPAKRILCELVKPCNGMTVMPVVTDELVIQMPDGAVSEAYRQLVEPFYLKL